ncbi:unnamed protein product [Soboliphyme baturini]|uniref:Uncharacterized protein n=1 Tax=Soboliphyme baturini TaxID=241478 RepID=A0A3P8DNH9_9BILA|nr:unnamed protein product [Soboliphyme baturini]
MISTPVQPPKSGSRVPQPSSNYCSFVRTPSSEPRRRIPNSHHRTKSFDEVTDASTSSFVYHSVDSPKQGMLKRPATLDVKRDCFGLTNGVSTESGISTADSSFLTRFSPPSSSIPD